MKKIQNSHISGVITIRVAKPMRFDGTVLIDRDIDAIVADLNGCGSRRAYSVYPIYGYPEGTAPQSHLDKFLETLDSCIADASPEKADKLMVESVRLRGIAKMGHNSYVGKGDQTLAEYWAKQ
ncbi:TPA: hypothetical protein ACTPQ1_004513 [Salmonella enterica]